MDMSKFVPKQSYSGSKINVSIKGNSLVLETDRRYKSRISIKRIVKPNNLFWFGIGLYEAEKSKNVIEKDGRLMASKVAFTNKDPKIIRSILKAFEKIGIKKSSWKGELQANINYIDKAEFEKNAPKYWSKQTGISIEKLRHYKYDKRKSKTNKKYKGKYFGILTVYQYNLCLKSFIDNFIQNIPKFQ